jgi:hypothetical protein
MGDLLEADVWLRVCRSAAGTASTNVSSGCGVIGALVRTPWMETRRSYHPESVTRSRDYFASGCGRIWNFITLLVVPLPVSMWNGVLVDIVVQTPRPFHPALGSSMRPSIHLV